MLPKMTPLWTNEMANPQTDTRVYPANFLPQLQQALGTLANLQLRYEIERDYLEDWSGPAEVKDRLVVELNECHAANRGGAGVMPGPVATGGPGSVQPSRRSGSGTADGPAPRPLPLRPATSVSEQTWSSGA